MGVAACVKAVAMSLELLTAMKLDSTQMRPAWPRWWRRAGSRARRVTAAASSGLARSRTIKPVCSWCTASAAPASSQEITGSR